MLTTSDIAQRFRCSNRKVTDEARRLGLGINLGGRAGMGFTEADSDRLVQALTPAAPTTARRRRRRSA